jgi:radical SAM protein with 4Fe4S-binding SPASM domain
MLKQLHVYLKTTETCQLNCEHCFTSGKNGRKIYFNPARVIDWFKRLKHAQPTLQVVTVEFHGGEPFLAPVKQMRQIWSACKDLFTEMHWSACTNLVFNLDDEKLNFMKEAFGYSIATSWDDGIRFDNDKQEELWRENVKKLVSEGFNITLMVSLSKQTIQKEPIELLKMAADLGVKYISLERLTPHGNAIGKDSIFPNNIDMDKWFLKMWEQMIEYEAWKWAPRNVFINGLLEKINRGYTGGVFCRNCETKMFTLNPDGSIGGCPNDAPVNNYGHIDMDIKDLFFNPGRMKKIACEAFRNPNCYQCPVFDICNGDCQQMLWQGNVCASPKSLIKHLKANNDYELFEKFLKD